VRIALLSDVNNPHTIRWVRALAKADHELLVFSLRAAEKDYFGGLGNVRVESAAVPSEVVQSSQGAFAKLTYLQAVPKLRRVLDSFQPAIVHAHYATSYGLLGVLAGRRPFAVSVWGMDVYDGPRSLVLRMLLKYVLSRADLVLSTSHVMREETLKLVARPIEVVPFGVDVERFAPREQRPSTLTIGTVKTLEPKYGIEYLVRAFAQLPRHGVELERVRLMIVGGGPLLSPLSALARELGIAERTEFTGRVDYEQIHRHQQELDIAVFPSVEDSESFGVAAVEAQACGVPAVVSRVGGLPEVVEDGVTGLVVPKRDPDALAAAIARLVLDEPLRRAMGLAARERVLRDYSLDHCRSRLEAIFASALCAK